jgi:hypothetical protein
MGTTSRSKRATAGAGRRRRAAPKATATGLAAPFLAETAEPVREHLAGSVTLGEFLAEDRELRLEDRRLLVEQALVLLEQNYVHLPLKAAMHAANPVQRLRLLRVRLQRQTPATMGPDWQFHAELSAIFHSVRDLHTNYLLPRPFSGKFAYLPFQVEEHTDPAGRHYLVSRLVQGFSAPGFGPGAEVTHWNGVAIDRAVDLNAARFAGSNPAARHVRGLDSLTLRPLRIHLPPDEEWVTVGYLGTDGQAGELRQPWLVLDQPPLFEGVAATDAAAAFLGVDLDLAETTRAKTLLFAPQVVDQAQAAASGAATAPDGDLPTSMPGFLRARTVTTPSGTFGHLRIFRFDVQDPAAFVAEFVRLAGLLPQNGLIVDVRGNGGGHIWASEFTLQTLTPHRIAPEPTQFIATPLNLRICQAHAAPDDPVRLQPWVRSMDQATETGATFSAAFAITPEDGANAIGQQYHGPVVLITDARCYSATDIFAAGFQDHRIGPVLGVDANTGAGGANVWDHGLLSRLLAGPDTPYRPLPGGANMRVAIRRTVRVGALAGTPVEDLGVEPDERRPLTRRDLLEGNQDLLDRAGELLAARPARRLEVEVARDGGGLTVTLQVANLDRADVYVDDRPQASVDLTGGTASVTVEGAAGAGSVRVEGFAGGELVAARTVAV